MSQNIRQFCNILINVIKDSGEQMSKIMRENFLRIDFRQRAQ